MASSTLSLYPGSCIQGDRWREKHQNVTLLLDMNRTGHGIDRPAKCMRMVVPRPCPRAGLGPGSGIHEMRMAACDVHYLETYRSGIKRNIDENISIA